MKKGSTSPLLRFFRLDRPADLWFPIIILIGLGVLIYAVLLQRSAEMASQQLAHCIQILDNAPGRLLETRMWPHAIIIYWLFSLISNPSPHAFAQIYTLYYGIGTVLFVLLLFRLCRRVASTLASTFACLYLIALYPLMLFDNYFQPGDPWGTMLAVLMVEVLLANRSRAWFYFLLLLSGIVWEKAVLLPFSVAIFDLKSRKKLISVIGTTILGVILAIAGQMAIRFALHQNDLAWSNVDILENIAQLPPFFLRVATLYGMQMIYIITQYRKVLFLFTALMLQFLVWPFIYFIMGGNIAEMRGLLIMVPYTWPVLAIFIDSITPSSQQQAH
jgi:hypothetical protein